MKMHNIFIITGYNRFLSLYIVRYILVIKSRKKLVIISIIWFEFMALFKFVGILNFGVKIKIDLVISLISLAKSVFNFDYLSLVVAFLYKIFMFFLISL